MLIVPSCDKVSERYGTYALAKEKGLFSRGWLPDIIPTSSRDILGTHDLDLNISDGEFSFLPDDAPIFISQLTPSSWSELNVDAEEKLKTDGYLPYEYVHEGSRWVFLIQAKQGHVIYKLVFGK